LDPQQSEQPIETKIQFAIDMGQNRRHSIVWTHVPTVILIDSGTYAYLP